MTLIYLARHGETEWNADRRIQGHTNSALTELGRRQAEALAHRLRKVPLKSIYSSDLHRALDTASPIASYQDLRVQSVPGLRERGYGEWEGLTIGEVTDRYPELWRRYHKERDISVAIPGAEEWSAVFNRVIKVVELALESHPDEDDAVLLVGHGGSLRVAVLHALGSSISMVTRIKMDNASLCCLEYRRSHEGRVAMLNDTGHLAGLKQ